MEFNVDILQLGKADAIIIWAQEGTQHFVVFLDGGRQRDAPQVLQHYRDYIAPEVGDAPYIVAVSTHMHSDHLGGLLKIVEALRAHVKRVFFNNPTASPTRRFSNVEQLELLSNPSAVHRRFITESLQEANAFEDLLQQWNIPCAPALSGTSLLPPPYERYLRIIGPSPRFYRAMMREAKQPWAQEAVDEALLLEATGNDPCAAVAVRQDTSAYNKASVLVELLTQQNRKYLFTADASSPSFEAILDDPDSGSTLQGYHAVQLPHHGSWRNFDARWAAHFGAGIFWASAPGDVQHPRPELVDCFKRQLTGVAIYSTHKLRGNWMRFTTSEEAFPRQTFPAQTL